MTLPEHSDLGGSRAELENFRPMNVEPVEAVEPKMSRSRPDELPQAPWRAQQVRGVLQIVPRMTASLLLLTAVAAWLCAEALGPALILPWAALQTLLALVWHLDMRRLGRRDDEALRSTLALLRLGWPVSLFSLLLAMLAVQAFPEMAREGQFLVGVMLGGALCAGAIELAALPVLSALWAGTLGVGALLALLVVGTPVFSVAFALLVLIGLLVSVSVRGVSRTLLARLQAQSEAARGEHTISMLLRDFETQSDAWTWSGDRAGRLWQVAPRMAAELGLKAPQVLVGQDLVQVLRSGEGGASLAMRQGFRGRIDARMPAELMALMAALQSGQPFRGIEVAVSRPGRPPSWWSISGVPVLDALGLQTGWRGIVRDVTLLRQQSGELERLARTDTLTGLANRHVLQQRAEAAVQALARRSPPVPGADDDSPLSLLLLDLDNFKTVNDHFGHLVGDLLLQEVARRLTAPLRDPDFVARLGGDEFGVLLEGCPLPQGIEIAEALRASVRDYRFLWEDKTFEIGVSIGIVAVTGERETVGSILSAADVACYAAKDLGRNRIHLYQDSDLDLARRHGEMQWVSRITQAIGEDRLELFCQDIVAVQTEDNLRHSVEILVRMRDERGELVSPAAFLPAAERYNLMPAIDRWVVHHCFRWLSSQPSLEGVLLSINLSGTTLSDDNFLAFIREQFERFRVPHDTVCFEITETAAIANQATASQFIRELRAMGCWFALDDFGSGLSSFAYLKNLPVDYLKIDGSFVRDMLHDPYDRAMVAAINEVGHRMGIRTIAEFVENRETLHALADLGVDYAQGWALGKPAPLREASAAAFRGVADQQLSA